MSCCADSCALAAVKTNEAAEKPQPDQKHKTYLNT